MKKRKPIGAKPGECRACAAEGILPSQAVACAMHSEILIRELQAEISVLKNTAGASSRLHLALADMYGAVPSKDGSEELRSVIDQRDRLDRVAKLAELLMLMAQWDDEAASKLEAKAFPRKKKK